MKVESDERPWMGHSMKSKPLGIIIHCMGQVVEDKNGKGWPARDWLQHIKVSAHATIEPDGAIWMCAPTTQEAWHAGESAWDKRVNLNKFYLGIEVLLPGSWGWKTFPARMADSTNWATEAQYSSTEWLCRLWGKEYPSIKLNNLVRHQDVSGPNVRDDPKVDPGKGFDFKRIWKNFQAYKTS